MPLLIRLKERKTQNYIIDSLTNFAWLFYILIPFPSPPRPLVSFIHPFLESEEAWHAEVFQA